MIPNHFSELNLDAPTLANLESLGYRTMTPIQRHSLPPILDGKDVIARAKTGSGKTAAFGIGLLNALDATVSAVQAMVICPTRELAEQVTGELRRLARFTDNVRVLTLCGGVPKGPQIGSLQRGAHVLVGTPGRLLDHLRRGNLALSELKTLVLDEADRMLEMGFVDDITELLAATPPDKQTLLFSATYPPSIAQLSGRFQRAPLEITVDEVHSDGNIRQIFYRVDSAERDEAVTRILHHYRPESTLIFCNTKVACQSLADFLQGRGFSALAIHGDMEQRDRDLVLVRFSAKALSVLVATDVAARGLDIKDLGAVINYELSHNGELHVHRIGRTGRAGETGLAFSLVTEREEHRAQNIESESGASIERALISTLPKTFKAPLQPPMVLLCLDGGRKNKLRPGDILGALTGEGGLSGNEVGKITVADQRTYIAIAEGSARRALSALTENKVKGRFFKVRPAN